MDYKNANIFLTGVNKSKNISNNKNSSQIPPENKEEKINIDLFLNANKKNNKKNNSNKNLISSNQIPSNQFPSNQIPSNQFPSNQIPSNQQSNMNLQINQSINMGNKKK